MRLKSPFYPTNVSQIKLIILAAFVSFMRKCGPSNFQIVQNGVWHLGFYGISWDFERVIYPSQNVLVDKRKAARNIGTNCLLRESPTLTSGD